MIFNPAGSGGFKAGKQALSSYFASGLQQEAVGTAYQGDPVVEHDQG